MQGMHGWAPTDLCVLYRAEKRLLETKGRITPHLCKRLNRFVSSSYLLIPTIAADCT